MKTISDKASDDPGMTRRGLLHPVLAGGTVLAAAALAGGDAGAEAAGLPALTSGSPNMLFDICVRFPAGKLDDWIKSWTPNVALLEARGQTLWAGWYGLTGQQDTATHQWAYRDLAHYQAMSTMRSTSQAVRTQSATTVGLEEILFSAVMTPAPYHPQRPPKLTPGDNPVIVTHRVMRPPMGADGRAHAGMMADYIAIAAGTGAELCGAYESFFGWTPSYLLHIWRYPSMEHYWASHDALAAMAEAVRLRGAMRAIYPHELVDLHRPMPYSPLR